MLTRTARLPTSLFRSSFTPTRFFSTMAPKRAKLEGDARKDAVSALAARGWNDLLGSKAKDAVEKEFVFKDFVEAWGSLGSLDRGLPSSLLLSLTILPYPYPRLHVSRSVISREKGPSPTLDKCLQSRHNSLGNSRCRWSVDVGRRNVRQVRRGSDICCLEMN